MSDTSLTITPSGGGTAYTLASSPGRSGDGTPVGPDGLDFRTDKGVLDREPIGADGIDSEPCTSDPPFFSVLAHPRPHAREV